MHPTVDLGIQAVGVFLMLVVASELTPEDFRRVAVYPKAVVAGILAPAIVAVISLGRPDFLRFAPVFFLAQVSLTLLAMAAFRAGHGGAVLAAG